MLSGLQDIVLHTLYTHMHISCTDPEDYAGVTTTLTFPAGSTEQVVHVGIVDDTLFEGPESFTAILIDPFPTTSVVLIKPQATINIEDNDGMIIHCIKKIVN